MVPVGNHLALSDAMAWVIENPDEASLMTKKAAITLERYKPSVVAGELMDFMNTMSEEYNNIRLSN